MGWKSIGRWEQIEGVLAGGFCLACFDVKGRFMNVMAYTQYSA